jgi:pimeloyl-ACP methyl ester carboxylesterase
VVTGLCGRRCIAPDARGHGQSGKPDPPYHWREFGEDLSTLLEQLNITAAIGVGHSMGGHSIVSTAALDPSSFSSLVLLDPTILPEDVYTGPNPPLQSVLRRKNHFVSADQMYERFKDRAPFKSWDQAVLRDYCDYGLNGVSLACPPVIEASIYAYSSEVTANIYGEIARIDVPVLVVRSRLPYGYGQFEGSPTNPELSRCFARAKDMHRTDVSHFIPMEAPDLTAALILGIS